MKELVAVTKLDEDVAFYEATIAADVKVEVGKRDRTNVAIRTDCGEEVLVSMIDCGDHLSIDLSVFTDAGEVSLGAFTMDNGTRSARIDGRLLVAMATREEA